MEQKLYLGSGFPPIDWEVVIQFKRSTVAQVDKNAGKKGLYLIQFKDSLHTAVVGTECAGIEDVLIGSYDVGEIVSNTSDLTLEKSRRNHWTCYGKRFIVSNCVISVGFITCPHTETRPVLEIVYSPLEGESILATVEVINEQIAMLAEELIPRGSLSTKKCLCSDAQFINIGKINVNNINAYA